MRRVFAILALLLVAALIAPGLPTATLADQKDPKLGALFDRLKATHDSAEAQGIEAQIWQIWMTSDDDRVNGLMQDGVAAMAIQDYRTALKDFSEMVRVAPNFAEGWNKRATLYYLMGDFGDSLADIDRTLALEPRHFGALSGLGLIRTEMNEEEKALDAFEKALAIDPHLSGAQKNAEELRQRIRGRAI